MNNDTDQIYREYLQAYALAKMGNTSAFTWNTFGSLSERAIAANAVAIRDAHAGELRGKAVVVSEIDKIVA
jgi:hypothetical protein